MYLVISKTFFKSFKEHTVASRKQDFPTSSTSSPVVMLDVFRRPSLRCSFWAVQAAEYNPKSLADRLHPYSGCVSSLGQAVETWWRNVLAPKSKWNSTVVVRWLYITKKQLYWHDSLFFTLIYNGKNSVWMLNKIFLETLGQTRVSNSPWKVINFFLRLFRASRSLQRCVSSPFSILSTSNCPQRHRSH